MGEEDSLTQGFRRPPVPFRASIPFFLMPHPTIHLKGFLFKRSGAFLQSWKKRFVQLSDLHIAVSVGTDESEKRKNYLLKDVEEVTIVPSEKEEKLGRSHVLQVILFKGKILYLSADTAKEVDEWREKIDELRSSPAVQKYREQRTLSLRPRSEGILGSGRAPPAHTRSRSQEFRGGSRSGSLELPIPPIPVSSPSSSGTATKTSLPTPVHKGNFFSSSINLGRIMVRLSPLYEPCSGKGLQAPSATESTAPTSPVRHIMPTPPRVLQLIHFVFCHPDQWIKAKDASGQMFHYDVGWVCAFLLFFPLIATIPRSLWGLFLVVLGGAAMYGMGRVGNLPEFVRCGMGLEPGTLVSICALGGVVIGFVWKLCTFEAPFSQMGILISSAAALGVTHAVGDPDSLSVPFAISVVAGMAGFIPIAGIIAVAVSVTTRLIRVSAPTPPDSTANNSPLGTPRIAHVLLSVLFELMGRVLGEIGGIVFWVTLGLVTAPMALGFCMDIFGFVPLIITLLVAYSVNRGVLFSITRGKRQAEGTTAGWTFVVGCLLAVFGTQW